VAAGQYVSSENGTAAFEATSSGTTGATFGVGVTFVRAYIQSLFRMSSVPTPTP
jgi:hypothetical protein